MSYRTVLTVAAVLSFLYGIGFMLLPGPISSLYAVELTDSGRYVAQIYGATLFSFGLLVRTAPPSPQGRPDPSRHGVAATEAISERIRQEGDHLLDLPGSDQGGWIGPIKALLELPHDPQPGRVR